MTPLPLSLLIPPSIPLSSHLAFLLPSLFLFVLLVSFFFFFSFFGLAGHSLFTTNVSFMYQPNHLFIYVTSEIILLSHKLFDPCQL